MAVNLGTAVGYLKLNTKDFISELNDAKKNADGVLSGLAQSSIKLVTKGLTASLIGAGTAFVAATGYAVNFASEVDTALNSFQTSTGSAKEQMEDFEDVMLNIYNNNFGENLEDISNAMSSVKKEVEDISPENLQALTENALLLRDVFDYDVNEQIRAANMLMEQFEISGDEAFTLIAQGAQKGLDKNGDLLDTINEYSVQFKQLGFNAEEMFNSLENGAESGTFSVDKLGDTIKEFGIRVKDGSKTTISAFEDLGLNVDETAEKFAKGGNEAKEAFYEVTDALFDLEDPLKKNQVGVELFGTMWEDLGEEGVKALTNLEGEIDQTADTLDELNEVKYDSLESSFEGIKRAINTGLVLPLGKEALPAFKKFAESISKGAREANGDIKKMSDVFGDALGDLASDLTAFIPDFIDFGNEIIYGLVDGIAEAAPELGEAVGELSAEFINNLPDLVATVFDGGVQLISGFVSGLVEGVPLLDALFGDIVNRNKEVYEALEFSIDKVTSFAEAIKNAEPNISSMDGVLSEYGNTVDDLNTKITTAQDAITDILASALQEQRELREEDLQSIKQYNDEIIRLEDEQISLYRDRQLAELNKLKLEKDKLQQEDAAQFLANAKKALDEANAYTEEAYTRQLTIIENKYKASGEIGSEAYYNELNSAKEYHDKQLEQNQQYYDEAVGIVTQASEDWLGKDKEKWDLLAEYANTFSTNSEEGWQNYVDTIAETTDGIWGVRDTYAAGLSQINLDTTNAFLTMFAEIKAKGGEIDTETKTIAQNILASFDGLPSDLDESGKDALLALISGLDYYVPDLENAADLTSDEIVDILRNNWGLDYESSEFTKSGNEAVTDLKEAIENDKVNIWDVTKAYAKEALNGIQAYNDGDFYTAGSNSSQGYINGFNSNDDQLCTIASNMASGALNAMKTVLGIASPSKEFGKIGMFSAQGYINNFEDEMEDGQKVIIDLSQLMLSQFFAQAKKFNSDIQRYKFLSGMFDVSSDYYSFAYSGKKINRNDNSGNEPQQVSGDTFNFYSPKPIDEIEAARQLKKVKQDIAEGFVY